MSNRISTVPSQPRRRLPIAALLPVILTLCACGGSGGGSNPGAGGPGGPGSGSSGGTVPGMPITSQQAFAQTVYPLVAEQGNGVAKCFRCHSEKAEGILPNFAHRNVEIAYNELVESQKVNLTNPQRSRIVQRLATDKHNC
ncbi:MAG: hypothetical protein ACR2RB_15280 [Gammaproteobacteria bacterium]